ncbi:hypothetical protein SNOG_13356 [Parastagonospora nodorum SN15]|uniref:Uncharacterized protein n=1 Tax=Phaeosphaeria nodorum (strain SN15 / ATCC MYA-4574 / FGSC 10173) TaxID=321614 RepID=Q0U4F8_PHANO|nr:hypothetical protein SNOG_13356 [Parastagonospora nodorum SN15]EAT79240.1 hypothetical protein SNOG_13356 [Parastagonospora nodorum SN15]
MSPKPSDNNMPHTLHTRKISTETIAKSNAWVKFGATRLRSWQFALVITAIVLTGIFIFVLLPYKQARGAKRERREMEARMQPVTEYYGRIIA